MKRRRILLDTHVWLWYLIGDARLSKRLINLISDADTDLFLSPFSVWEAILLGERKRIEMKDSPAEWVKSQLGVLGATEPPFTTRIAQLSRTLEFIHDDPVDRFLAATAYDQKLTLATADRNLMALKWLETVS